MMTTEHIENPLIAHLRRVAADLSAEATSLGRDRTVLGTKLDRDVRAFVQGKLSATQDAQRRVARAFELAEYEIEKLNAETHAAVEAEREIETQIERLGAFIIETVPGEPSQSQGAVDTAMRIIGDEHAQRVRLETMLREANGTIEQLQQSHDILEARWRTERGEAISTELAARLHVEHDDDLEALLDGSAQTSVAQ